MKAGLAALWWIAAGGLQAAPLPPDCWLRDVAAKGEAVWLLCEEGPLLKSADSGKTWSDFPSAVEWAIAGLGAT